MLKLKYNSVTQRYDVYNQEQYVATLTCGTRFNYYDDEIEDLCVGCVEDNSTYGYYWIGDDGVRIIHLQSGMKGTLD